MKSEEKKHFMKLCFGDPFSMNSTLFSLIIPPTQEIGSVAGLIKESNTYIDECVFKHCTYLAMINYHFTYTCICRRYIRDCRKVYQHFSSTDFHAFAHLFKRL